MSSAAEFIFFSHPGPLRETDGLARFRNPYVLLKALRLRNLKLKYLYVSVCKNNYYICKLLCSKY